MTRITLKLANIGYAVPGAVLAVGIFVAFAWLDRAVPPSLRDFLGIAPGALLQGSVTAMLVAYMIRFLAVGFGPLESALHRVTRSIDEAATALGQGGVRLLDRVHLPLLRGGLATAAVLVFVDVLKEMPITLDDAAVRLGYARDSNFRADLRRAMGVRRVARIGIGAGGHTAGDPTHPRLRVEPFGLTP